LKIFTLLLLTILASARPAFSQNDTASKKAETEMNVDLPDETQETDLVDKGQVQMETSFLYNRYTVNPTSVLGQGLLRYGLLSRVELRLLIEDGRQRDKYMEETTQSTYPLAAGTKVALLKDVKGLPDITFVGYLKLPFTSRSKEQKAYWSPMALLAFQNKFGGDKWKLEYNIGGQQEAYSTSWFMVVNASLHYKLLEKLELYTEYYSQYQPGSGPQHNIGGGAAYEIGHAIEVYASAGGSILRSPANHYFQSGVAFRLP
jgi:hypothetical protein